MKRTLKWLFIPIVAAAVLVLAGCEAAGADGGESDSGGGTPSGEPADTDVTVVEDTAATAAQNAAAAIPSDDPASAIATSIGSTFSSIGSYFSAWDTSQSGWTQSGSTWTYEQSFNSGETITYRWEVSATTGGWRYSMYFDTDEDGELELFFRGEVSENGDSGSLDYYVGNDTPILELSWSTSGDTVTYTYDYDDGSETYSVEMTTSVDGSNGSIEINDGSTTQTYTW